MRSLNVIRIMQPEALFWVAGLVYLAVTNPSANDHYNFCVVKRLGFRRCPGCGLGRSISYLFHGDLVKSYKAHPLGIFAVVVLTARIFSLIKINLHT